MTQFKNNPLTCHPLADQSEWFKDDGCIREIETIRNQKTYDVAFAPLKAPSRVQEAGVDIARRNGSLTIAALRTKEGVSRV